MEKSLKTRIFKRKIFYQLKFQKRMILFNHLSKKSLQDMMKIIK